MTLNDIRKWSLTLAESIDAYRVVPRIILLAYGWMVWRVTQWYISIPTANSTSCQADVLSTVLDRNATIEQARAMACSVAETVGGPTSEQTMFVSIIVGLSSVVIGLYLNTGTKAKWQGEVLQTINPAPPMGGRMPPDYYGGGGGYPSHGRGRGRFDQRYDSPFADEEPERPSPHQNPSWFQRMRGKAGTKTDGQQDMPEPPDLGEDEYQG